METASGLTTWTHPNTLTSGEIGDLSHLSNTLARHSPEYSKLIGDWIARERVRRESGDEPGNEPVEPALMIINCVKWSNDELAKCSMVATVALIVSEDSSPRVRRFHGEVAISINSWVAARLAPKHLQEG